MLFNLINKYYCFKSCEREYLLFLKRAKEMEYAILSLEEYYDKWTNGKLNGPVIALRHDVDGSDIRGNEMFFNLEKTCGARATYYFRLLFINKYSKFVDKLFQEGFSVGYHFEEPATFAKLKKLKSRQEVFEYRHEISELFNKNCDYFRLNVNSNLKSVCSHGDWINRKLGFANHELLDYSILEGCRIQFEAYNNALINSFRTI